jgi:hypothetical protein
VAIVARGTFAYGVGHPADDDRKESAMEATNSDGPQLSRVFAPMLSELEDHATRLTTRQAELARELAAVDEELARVESVRAAMVGKNPRRPSSTAREARKGSKKTARVEAITTWARERGGEFTGIEVAEVLGMTHQGIGPILAGMARRGELTVRDDTATGRRVYALA